MSPAPSNGPTTDVSSALLFGTVTRGSALGATKAATLAMRHPCYLEVESLRSISRDAMDWRRVRQAGQDYLMLGENEDGKDFLRRLSISPFDTIAESIVESMVSQLHKHPLNKLKVPPVTDAILDDVDLCGSDFDAFRRHAEREALVSGMEWILANKKRGVIPAETAQDGDNGNGAAKRFTLANQQAQGARDYLELIPGEQIIYWYPPVGELDFAIREYDVEIDEPDAVEPWLTRPECRKRWTVWTRDKFITYEITKEIGANDLRVVEDESGDHTVGRVPLEPLYGSKRGEKMGYPAIEPVMSHIFTLYNLESDLVWYLRISGHPIPYHWGPKGLAKSDVGVGFYLQTETGHNSGAAFLETSGAAYGITIDYTKLLRQRIVSIILRKTLLDSRQVAAADTQREDKDSINGSLAATARRNAATWKRALDNMARWRGDDSDSAIVEPNVDFDDEAVTADVMNALTAQVDAGIVPPEIVREIEVTAGILPEAAANHKAMQKLIADFRASKEPMQDFSAVEEDLSPPDNEGAKEIAASTGAGA